MSLQSWPGSFGGLRSWTADRWLVAGAATTLAALAVGIPTGVVRTSLYRRMTPVTWWDYPVWMASAAVLGLLAATYLRARPVPSGGGGRALGGGVLATLAIGCPICNKIVVALIGVSGALGYWAPLQPILGLSCVALLLVALVARLRGELSCSAPATGPWPT